MDPVEPEVKAEFMKYMDIFKSWGKQGDEGFYMKLSPAEADEVLRSSTQIVQPTHLIIQTQPMVTMEMQNYTGEEEGRSPSPPRIGFAGPVIK